SRARAQLLVVVVPQLLAAEGPGPPARPHVGFARACPPGHGAPVRRGDAALGAALRPRAAGHGVQPLNGSAPGGASSRRAAQAIDALRHGWPVRIGDAPVLLPVETAPGAAHSPRTLISAARAAT